jgi:DNA repair photolyase
LTVTTFDDVLCRKIERNVIPTSKRFECLETYDKRGIPVGIWMGPILPFINDNEVNIIRIVDRCIEIGMKYIVVFDFGTTKREGSEEYFYRCLDKYFPGVKEKYIRAYGKAYECRSPNAEKLWACFKQRCQAHGILYDLEKINEDFNKSHEFVQLSLFD